MPYYLKFPPSTGDNSTNKALCQISGIVGTLQTVRYKLAESIPTRTAYRYIFDIRRAVDSTADNGGTGWILQTDWVQTAGTSNFKINNSPVDASALFAGAADDVCSFDVNQDLRQGCIAFGCRFNEVESNYGLSVYYIEIVDSVGTHTIDMSSSNGTLNQFTSTDGVLTLKLFNFTGASHWVPYGSAPEPQAVTIPAAKQQDVAAVVSVGAIQSPTVPAVKQQDVAATVTVSTTQAVTVPAAKQQDITPAITVSATQVLAVVGAQQQDVSPTVTVGTSQLVTVPAAKQQDVAAAVTVAQVVPGSQPVTIPAVKQQDTAGVVVVSTTQVVAVAGAKQQDKASSISVGQSQNVTVAPILQQDKAALVNVGTTQVVTVQPVAQNDTAARVQVGTTQILVVPPAQQVDKAAAVIVAQSPPITRPIDVRTLRIELTTPRIKMARTTQIYTAQLTTPRYSIART